MSVLQKNNKADKKYVLYLKKQRSITAFIACVIIVVFSFYAIAGGMELYVEDDRPGLLIFQWFTTISNFITCLSACMITPFAVEGIRRKHFAFPRWISVCLYSGMVCTTLTMAMTVAFISWSDPALAFGDYNVYLHIVCPIMVIISFFMVESGYLYTINEAVLATVPVVLYVIVYFIEVVVIGEANGGWEDLYHVLDYVPIHFAVAGVILIGFGLSFIIRIINNKLVIMHRRRRLAKLWPENVSPAEIKMEMLGLGRFMGRHSDAEFVELYLDIIIDIADHYNLKTEDLIRPYIKGFVDSYNEKGKGIRL